MTLFGRYMFKQVANAFLVILLTLTSVVWLATALKELNLITSQGQGFLLFLQMTMLSLPSLIALIAPNAMLMAALYTLDRMNGDSDFSLGINRLQRNRRIYDAESGTDKLCAREQ